MNIQCISTTCRTQHCSYFRSSLPPPPPPPAAHLNFGLGRLMVSTSHTIGHTSGGIPLNERSAPSRGRYLHNTQTQDTNIYALCGIRTRDHSNPAAADLPLDHTATRIGYVVRLGNPKLNDAAKGLRTACAPSRQSGNHKTQCRYRDTEKPASRAVHHKPVVRKVQGTE